MLDEATRTAILRLRTEGHGTRRIARALGVSRGAVKEVLGRGTSTVPRIERTEKAEAHEEEIRALHESCKGNLVRVHEELCAQGLELSYQALTAYCRRHAIGHAPPLPAGRYHFAPGQEMQHDTSPHVAEIGGHRRRVQTASLVLCYSRMIFVQLYPRFDRFTCKIFLTDALEYFGAAARVCMIDNTSVVVLRGTGREMVAVPEMAAFAERLGFVFQAHERGDANRSARVERPFSFIENNFLAGRSFADFADVNRQAHAWCDVVNARHRRHLHASARELFSAERAHLRALPLWVPEVYALHHRIVDVEGYVCVNTNRYSVPYQLIGRRMEVRETRDAIAIYDGPRRVAEHRRVVEASDLRVTAPEHRPPRGERSHEHQLEREERDLVRQAPELKDYVAGLKRHAVGRGTRALRQLARLVRDYPRPPLLEAIAIASHYGLFDLERLESMILRRLAGDYFRLPPDARGDDNDDGNDGDDDDNGDQER